MKSRILACMIEAAAIAALAIPNCFAAQAQGGQLAERPPRIRISDAEHCYEFARTNPDVAVYYCSAASASNQLSRVNLAVTPNNRGNAYLAKSDYQRAIQDKVLGLLRQILTGGINLL
jgi:hypothetical protein